MVIIEQGNKTYECKTCGCKFILEGHEYVCHHYGNYGVGDLLLGDTTSRDYDYVFCPQCGMKVKIGGQGNIK